MKRILERILEIIVPLAILCITSMLCARKEAPLRMLIGTYTDGNASQGVYLFEFNPDDVTFSLLDTARAGNPSFIIPSADRRYAWSVGEYDDGRQCAYSYRLGDSTIDAINCQSTDGEASGAAPCNVIAVNGHLVTSNYSGGTLSSFPINEDGTLGPLEMQFVPQTGGSTHSPHLHCAFLSPDGKYLFANDLGLDAIYRFELENDSGPIKGSPLANGSVAYRFDSRTHPGPRHAVFSADGRFVYVIHELGDLLTVLSYNDGCLNHVSTVPAYHGEGHGSADIHLSPDGRFLYTSHRLKEDGISVFAVNREDGSVTNTGYCRTGRHPRNFAITPDGSYLLCACRDDNRIEIYSIDSQDGLLTFTGKTIDIPSPVCVQFL